MRYFTSVKKTRQRTRIPVETRFWRFVKKTNTCWLWTGATTAFGYGLINAGGRAGKTTRAHRISYTLHVGPIPAGLCVLHRCDTPACVNPAHLFLGTYDDNNKDMKAKGRCDRLKRPKGEQHGCSVLTETEVRGLRALHATGLFTYKELGTRFGVSLQSAWRIAHYRNWKHVGC
jgi:hypothetical protein